MHYKNMKNMGLFLFMLVASIHVTLYAPKKKIPKTPNILADKNFSWIFNNAIGGIARPNNKEVIKALDKLGVGLLITLTTKPLDIDWFKNTNIKNIHIPIPDFTTPTFEQVDQFVQEADKAFALKKSVVVHCAAGIGRTGTMLASWLVAKKQYSALQALAFVRARRPGSIETKEQLIFVGEYAKHLYEKHLEQLEKEEEEREKTLALMAQLHESVTVLHEKILELEKTLQTLHTS